jgi:hypothetical protein
MGLKRSPRRAGAVVQVQDPPDSRQYLGGGGGGVTDHGALSGLADNDHPQYLTAAEGNAAYQPLDADLTAIAAANNGSVLAGATASFTTADETKLDGIESGATADQSNGEIETAYNAQVAAASQGEAEAGTEAAIRRFSPLRVAQAIAALAGGPGGDPLDAWPIGSVFIAVVSTSPATLLGGGTWEAFGAGRVLVGRDSGDTDFDTAEETGGAKTKAISAHAGTAVADHASHTHTYTEVPNHVHVQSLPSGQTGGQASGTRDTSTNGSVADALSTANPTGGVATGTTNGPNATLTHSVTQPSAHSDLNVVQPYIVVYMWKRTA